MMFKVILKKHEYKRVQPKGGCTKVTPQLMVHYSQCFYHCQHTSPDMRFELTLTFSQFHSGMYMS